MSKTSNRLTPKQEKFCLEYVKGGRKSLSDATGLPTTASR